MSTPETHSILPKDEANNFRPLVRLLLLWYYGYHKAIDAHKQDHGDAAIKPHFLPVYRETDEFLSAMRKLGTLTDEECKAAYDLANARHDFSDARQVPTDGETK